MTTLDAALDAYSLTTADLPGIEDAWNARFADLDQPLGESGTEALARLVPKTATWQNVSVEDLTPRADGSLVLEVEYGELGDQDREHITLDAEQAREYLTIREGSAERIRLIRLRSEAANYGTGEMPVWWLNADQDVLRRHGDAGHQRSRAIAARARFTDLLRDIDRLQAALDTHAPLTAEEEKSFRYADGYLRGVMPHDATNHPARDKRAVSVNEVNTTAKNLATHTPEILRLQEAIDAAYALPAGALRDYLVGERPAQEYSTVEGAGRRKRNVKKSYVPVSDLVRDHRTARAAHTRAAEARDDITKRLTAMRTAAQKPLADATARVTEATAAFESTWAEGWVGAGAPPAPLTRDEF